MARSRNSHGLRFVAQNGVALAGQSRRFSPDYRIQAGREEDGTGGVDGVLQRPGPGQEAGQDQIRLRIVQSGPLSPEQLGQGKIGLLPAVQPAPRLACSSVSWGNRDAADRRSALALSRSPSMTANCTRSIA